MNIEFAGIITITLAVTSAFKYAGLNTRWLPLVSIIVGVATTLLFVQKLDWLNAISGVLTGLVTSGLYDFSKYTVLGNK